MPEANTFPDQTCGECRTRTFDIYSDPGHGWMRVPRALLDEIGLAGKITSSSYQRGGYVYLEEDVDMSTFIKAMNDAGFRVNYRSHNSDRNSAVRGYAPYHTTSASAFAQGQVYYHRKIWGEPGTPVRVTGTYTDKRGETWVLGVSLGTGRAERKSDEGKTFIYSPADLAATPAGKTEAMPASE